MGWGAATATLYGAGPRASLRRRDHYLHCPAPSRESAALPARMDACLQPKDARTRTRTGPGSGRELISNGLVAVLQYELDELILEGNGVYAFPIRQDPVGIKSI
jgi:hypothetical protein